MRRILDEFLTPTQMVHLATCEEGQPRLRPMTMIYKEGKIYFATGATDAKIGHLEGNPKVEFCLLLRDGVNTGYLRGSGSTLRLEDPQIKREVADHARFIYDYWPDSADPGFALLELQLRQLRVMRPGEMLDQLLE